MELSIRFWLSFVLGLLLVTASAGAAPDSDPPQLLSFSIESATLSAGQTVRIRYEATDQSGISEVAIVFNTPDGRPVIARGTGSVGVATLLIDPTMPNGSYSVRHLIVYDGAVPSNNATYLPDGSLSSNGVRLPDHSFDLTVLNFVVMGNSAGDTDAPKLLSFSIESATLSAGATVRIRYEATDPSGISEVAIVFNTPDGRPVIARGTGSVGVATLLIDPTMPNGSYSVRHLIVYDGAVPSNNATYLPDGSLSSHGVQLPDHSFDLTALNFVVGGNSAGDADPPELLSFSIESKTLVAGQTVRVRYEATDPSGISEVAIVFNTPDGRPVIARGTGSPGVATLLIDGTMPHGTYTVRHLIVYDGAVPSNNATYLPDGSLSSHGVQLPDHSFDLTVLNFVVGGAAGQVTLQIDDQKDGVYSFQSSEPALNFTISTVGGTGGYGPVQLDVGTYVFAFSVPEGVGIADARCTAGGEMDASARTGKLVVEADASITCTIRTVDALGSTAALIGGLMETRARVILDNAPDLKRRLERLEGNYSSNGGIAAYGFGLTGSAIPFGIALAEDSVSFSYSLRRSQVAGDRLRFFGTPPTSVGGREADLPNSPGISTGLAAYGPESDASARGEPLKRRESSFDLRFDGAVVDPMQQRFDVWTEGRFGHATSGALDGEFLIGHAGADYLLTRDLLVGFGAQLDHIELDGKAGASVGGTGFMIGPYATARLAPWLYADARVAWGRSFNDVSPFGTYDDKFDGDRWLATAALVGSYDFDRLSVIPELRLSYFKERSQAYVDKLGVAIPSFAVETGQVEFGPTFRYAAGDALMLEPFLTVKGIWTFQQENTATAASGSPGAVEEGLRGRVEAGLAFTPADDIRVSGALSYDGIGEGDYKSWSGQIRIGKRF